MATKRDYEDYNEFLKKVGTGIISEGVALTHDGYPLSVKEEKFISLFVVYGDMKKALKEADLTFSKIRGKDYISDEIAYRLDELKKKTIADSDEILQYFTKVMRGQEKDQFGLDAPLGERTNAAKELARRIIDIPAQENTTAPEIKVTLNWD